MCAVFKMSVNGQKFMLVDLEQTVKVKWNVEMLTILQDTAAIIGTLTPYVLFSSLRYVRGAVLALPVFSRGFTSQIPPSWEGRVPVRINVSPWFKPLKTL